MITLLITNSKGGVGKTPTTDETAYILASKYKKRVLIVDFDAQCDTTRAYGFSTNEDKNMFLVMMGVLDIRQAIKKTQYDNLDIIPSSPDLLPENFSSKNINCLKTELRKLRNDYDFVLIDSAPSAGCFRKMNYLAADYIVGVTSSCPDGKFGLLQMSVDIEELTETRKDFTGLTIGVLHSGKGNNNISRLCEIECGQAAEALGTTCFTPIRWSTQIDKARFLQKPINVFAKSSAVAEDYRTFVYELLERIKWIEEEREA